MTKNEMNDWNKRANDIFADAMLIEDAEARVRFIENECGDDDTLRHRVDSLIQASPDASQFLDDLVEEAEGLARPTEDAIGSTIGSFKLLQEIGRGGFGVVFMAQQLEPIRRKVALKIIKRGMDTREVIARFEAERQALALMDHPNIAKVIDAGETKDGRPYFVMELVKGIRITEFCDENRLSTEARLRLFKTVCEAVHHAHQKGVIHRDLKPSNVMVAMADRDPVAKVIDFGIAKAINQELTEKTLFTAYGQLIGTPEYMSPEQAKVNALDVDTRSDVYSLGVLLFEVITGSTPIDGKKLRSSSYDEMRRLIREEESPTPSSRLLTLGNQTEVLASLRDETPSKLIGTVKGELDWITLKCLDKDRNRRYDSANDIASDIQAFLDNDEVAAVAPSSLYKLQKLWSKHRLVATATAVVLVSLLAATIISVISATSARSSAELATQRSSELQKAEKTLTELSERQRQVIYALDMYRADQSIKHGQMEAARSILSKHSGDAAHTDLRGIEWRYLSWESRNQQIARFPGIMGGMSLDGRLFAYAEPTQIVIRELQPPFDEVARIATDSSYAQRLSPKGKYLACMSEDAGVEIWDLKTKKRVAHWPKANNPMRFSPDGTKFYFLEDNGFKLVKAGSWDLIHSFETQSFGAFNTWGFHRDAINFTTDSRYFVYPTSPVNAKWKVFDLVAMQPVSDKLSRTQSGAAAACSMDGRFAVSPVATKVIEIWDMEEDKLIAELDRHTTFVTEVDFSQDGKYLVSASGDNSVKVWDAKSYRLLCSLHGHPHGVWTLDITPDSKYILSGGWRQVCVWEVDRFLNEAKEAAGLPVGFLANGGFLTLVDQSEVAAWDLRDGQPQQVWKVPIDFDGKLLSGSVSIPAVDSSSDDRHVAFGRTDGFVNIWSISQQATLHKLAIGDGKLVGSVRFSPARPDILAVATVDGTIQTWDASTGTLISSLPPHIRSKVQDSAALAFSEDGATIGLTCSGVFRIFRLASDASLEEAKTDFGFGTMHPVATTSKNAAIHLVELGNGSKGLSLINIESGEVATRLDDAIGGCDSIPYLDDKTMVSVHNDQTIRMWHLKSRQLMVTIPTKGLPVAISRRRDDGIHLLVGSRSHGTTSSIFVPDSAALDASDTRSQ